MHDAAVHARAVRHRDQDLQNLVHDSLEFKQHAPDYGDVRRRLKVIKGRSMRYRGGYHNFRICTGGLEVYPRLERGENAAKSTGEVRSGADGPMVRAVRVAGAQTLEMVDDAEGLASL